MSVCLCVCVYVLWCMCCVIVRVCLSVPVLWCVCCVCVCGGGNMSQLQAPESTVTEESRSHSPLLGVCSGGREGGREGGRGSVAAACYKNCLGTPSTYSVPSRPRHSRENSFTTSRILRLLFLSLRETSTTHHNLDFVTRMKAYAHKQIIAPPSSCKFPQPALCALDVGICTYAYKYIHR